MATMNAWRHHCATQGVGGLPIKVMLLTDTHVTDVDAQEFISQVNANEAATGSGYPAGGYTLAGFTIARNDTDNRTELQASNYVAENVTTAYRYYAFYTDSGDPATSRIINIVDNNTGATVNAVNQDLTIPMPDGHFWRFA